MADELIPLFGIFMIIAVVIGPIWITQYFKARDRREIHETIRLAYEKGQTPDAKLVEQLYGAVETSPVPMTTAEGDLRRAIVLISVGLGIAGLGWGIGWGISYASLTGGAITAGAIAGSGAIPALIGVAYLILWLNRRKASNVTKI